AHGLAWIEPPVMLAHPLDGCPAAAVYRSMDATADRLGVDGARYTRLVGPIAAGWSQLEDAVLGPPRWPRHPLAVARFGLTALQPAAGLARRSFSSPAARGLLAGL